MKERQAAAAGRGTASSSGIDGCASPEPSDQRSGLPPHVTTSRLTLKGMRQQCYPVSHLYLTVAQQAQHKARTCSVFTF